MFRFASAAFGLTVAVALTAGAWAAPALVRVQAVAPLASGLYQMRATTVSFDDLDVTSAEGAAALYQRIEAASHVACGETMVRHIELETKYAACRARAVAGAVSTVNAPRLNEIALATH